MHNWLDIYIAQWKAEEDEYQRTKEPVTKAEVHKAAFAQALAQCSDLEYA